MGLLGQLSEQLGVSSDQLALILLLIGSVPASLVFPYLPSSDKSNLPHLYAALPSIFIALTLNLGGGFLQLLASSVATWLLVQWGVKTKQGKTMPWIVFAVVMGHLAVNHILRHIEETSLDTIEITGSQMVLCMKLISFAWSVYDGQRPDEELDATQRGSRIQEVPGLIPFLGYAFFFPSVLAGPAFTYASYKTFTSHALFKKEVSPSDKTSSLIPPGRRSKAAKRFVTGLVFLGIYALYSWKWGYGRLLEPEYSPKSIGGRVLFMNVAGFVARTKYYAVWCIAESAFILSGLGYNPATKHYDASRNVRIRSIEFAPNFKILLDSWNMNTNVWLRECIYKRVAKKGRKPGFKSTQITFITSALWHGVNPCYLMTFVLGGFFQSLGRSLRKLVRPFFLPPGALLPPKPRTDGTVTPPVAAAIKLAPPPQTPLKWFYDVVGIVCTQLALNFTVAPFMLLSVTDSLAAWRAVGYYGLFLVGVPMLVFNFGLAKKLSIALKKRDAKADAVRGEDEKKRIAYEKEQERKRVQRGQIGVASMGMDVEELMEEEEREEKRRKQGKSE